MQLIKKDKKISFAQALSTLLFLVAMLAIAILRYEVDLHVPLFAGTIYACIIGIINGYKYEELEEAIFEGIRKSIGSVLILTIIGILIGVWIDTGVVSAMIYYGLKIIRPSLFLVSCVLLSSVVSIATGASWGTIATIGVALMGIGYGLEMPAPMTAGAIISGAYFGDKVSPLSDTTNLAPTIAGTDVMKHIRFMLKSTVIGYVFALLCFLVLGFVYSSGTETSMHKIIEIQTALDSLFNINIIFLLPPAFVIFLVILKLPVLPSISFGILSAALLGFIFQPGCHLGTVFEAGMNGFNCNTGMKELDDLLNSGGLMNMMYSVSMVIVAMCFGGVMEVTKQFNIIISPLKRFITGPARLIILTELTCIFSNMIMPEQYISILVPGSLFKDEYEKMDLDPLTLSNALESSGTVSSPLIPWNTCGAYIGNTLGISTFAYLPWCIFNLTMPVLTAILAMTGKLVIKHKDKESVARNG